MRGLLGSLTTKVFVHDNLMGTGKSTRMIDTINNSDKDVRWIVVAPFLGECHRYAGTMVDASSKELQTPMLDSHGDVIYTGSGCSASGRKFRHPSRGYKGKVGEIGRMIERGEDIVTTHSALKHFTPDTIKHIRDAGYRLVIDEELECIRPVNLSPDRRQMILGLPNVYVDDRGLLRWDDVKHDGYYNGGNGGDDRDENNLAWDTRIKTLCNNGSLLLVDDDSGGRNFLMWEYPVEFIKAFERIDVLTYMFEGSVFQRYLQFYNIECSVISGIQMQRDIKDLLHIVGVDDDFEKMNKFGDRSAILSATDSKGYKRDSAVSKIVRGNLENFFTSVTHGGRGVSVDKKMWTCLKGSVGSFKGNGYTRRHVPHNIKAVNDYIEVEQMAYVYNTFLHPDVYRLLHSRGNPPNSDIYSLTELLQWVYRSGVRRGEGVKLYIPSSRMRGLLVGWRDGVYHSAYQSANAE